MVISAWVKEADTGRSITFNAPPGLTGFSVVYSVNDGNGTPTTMSSPTVTEIDGNDLPGIYRLDLDETGMVTRSNSNNFETVIVHITNTSPAWTGTALSYVLYTESP